jgi:CRP-like cAMP-binding protein
LNEITLVQGCTLQEPGADIKQVYFPHSGIICLLVVMGNGDVVETAMIGQEGALNATIGGGFRHAFNRAIVGTPGEASRISIAHFQEALSRSSRMRETFLFYNEILLAQVQQASACYARHEVIERLARWLLQSADGADHGSIPFTQEIISQMLGVRRTTVTQAAQFLQSHNLIRYRRGRIEITDRTGLEHKACECYSNIKNQHLQFQKDLEKQIHPNHVPQLISN